ncbi:radical SAM protein [Selenomonas caprae]|uniref:Radical SAM protein, TatD family-associated n=2 Tax=Selenomonas TaxID=970 RepID=A0A1I3FZR2_SELRU|nr:MULTISPECIES: TatD family nuclease-associated radical SAM protein [Selenomonas]MBQ1889135.1 radical SAM protein [Selenomonas sp.]TYZ31117.1 radical SAM protein [Selenomonas caprae]SFI16647.1 radical SAM protein, TatD family-associated [Selenomonas ruminantium]
MLVYATHAGGKYMTLADSLRLQPEGKRNLYVNITNACNCACTFCLRNMKEMAEESSLWLKEKPTLPEFKAALDSVPWDYIKEVVFCGFGEPTMELATLVELLHYVKKTHPDLPTRLNTNGLGNLEYGRDIAADFAGILDTVSISLNASNAERYYELTRAKYGIKSYEAMLDFAERSKQYVPNVVLTIVDKVEGPEEIARCREICAERGLTLRVREYEDS